MNHRKGTSTGLMDLVGVPPEEVRALLEPLGEPPYRGDQVFNWIHDKKVADFQAMTNLPLYLRRHLEERFVISTLEPDRVLESGDGSMKLVFGSGARAFHAVLMPFEDRVTLCISSQVGCAMGCMFCKTGTMGRVRNLTASEMVGQVIAASRLVGTKRRVSNVVFMGMGEPLDNLDAVVRAVRVTTHRKGLKVAPRRTTVSTVGLVPGIRRFLAAGTGASLAISLCGTTDDVRSRMTPIGAKWDIESLVSTLSELRLGHGHRYTIEYLLIAGVSDGEADARRLSRILARFPSKVNLIPFNPWPGCGFERPPDEVVRAFARFLSSRHHLVTVRESRGRDIGAACGQLGPLQGTRQRREAG